MLCSPEAKFIVWLIGDGRNGGFLVADDAYRPFCSQEGEATSQFGCMKTMLWWKARC